MQKTVQLQIDRALIESIKAELSDALATRLYYKALMLKFIPEIRLVKSGKLKALKNDEIGRFLREHAARVK